MITKHTRGWEIDEKNLKCMNLTHFHPKRIENVKKSNILVNIRFVAKTSDIRNFSQNIRSDVETSEVATLLATTELFPKETKNRETARKWQKCVWVWCLRLAILRLCNHAELYSLAWWSLTAQAKDPFQDSKELKMNWTVAMFQERLSTVTNLGKQIVMNSQIILLWRRPGQNLWTVYCVMFSLTWFDDCSFLFLYMYFNNDSISGI